MNEGKKFESDFRDSISKEILLYRLPDAAQSFNKNSCLRFSRKNPFDYLMWDFNHKTLYALELKTVKGKSISFERSKEDHAKIHIHQIEGLNAWNKYKGIRCGFIIDFRGAGVTIFIDIVCFNELLDKLSKKSFTIDDLILNGIDYIVIPRTLKRTRYKYDISPLLDSVVG